MESLIIAELKNTIPSNPGEYAVCGQISGSIRKQTRNGNPYYEVELCDSSGSIKLKAWQDSVAFSQAESLKGSEWVKIRGQWSSNEYGLDARDWLGFQYQSVFYFFAAADTARARKESGEQE